MSAIDDEGRATLLRSGALSRADIEAITGPLAAPPIKAPSLRRACSRAITLPARAFGSMPMRRAQAKHTSRSAAPAPPHGLTLSASGDLIEAAANLYAHLRALDASGAHTIAVAPIPAHGLGEAIRDRLARAAAPRCVLSPCGRGQRLRSKRR